MREVKFRAWDGNAMHGHFMLNSLDGSPWDAEPVENEQSPLLGWQVMQFTGLRDTNGVEIYEGDVIEMDREMHPHLSGRWPIIYRNAAFVVGESGMYFWDYADGKSDATVRVIGNIHQNPELLEG